MLLCKPGNTQKSFIMCDRDSDFSTPHVFKEEAETVLHLNIQRRDRRAMTLSVHSVVKLHIKFSKRSPAAHSDCMRGRGR